MPHLFDHGYALLVGIGQCSYSQFSLPVTVKDVKALQQILVDPELCAYPDNDQHVRVLHDQKATNQAILDGLEWLAYQAEADPDATIIVYYSGHGWLDTESDKYYLIPHNFDVYDWQKTSLSSKDFNQALRQIDAKRLLVILDCCHAAAMASAKNNSAKLRLPKGVMEVAAPSSIIDLLCQGEGRVVFTSCRSEQKSWILENDTMSVYTYHLIEALQGAASQISSTEVTIFDLANYIGKKVPITVSSMGQEQNPRFEMADTERFSIALIRGGKGLQIEKEKIDKIKNFDLDNNNNSSIFSEINSVKNEVNQKGKYNINSQFISGRLQFGDSYYSEDLKKKDKNNE